MQYVDLGNGPTISQDRKRRKRKRLILLGTGLVAAVLIGVLGYAFYWPLSALIGEFLKNPGIALSFFRDPSGQLKSTDGKTNT